MVTVVNARNVEHAYILGLDLLSKGGVRETSRAGDVLVYPTPVITTYAKPLERVLFNPTRDANPFFHLFEALWLLTGSQDARWLDRFVKDFSSRFAEDDGNQHGAYGYRWRYHFDMEGGGNPNVPNQLDTIVRMLKENPQERRAVLTMWDPVADLGAKTRDIPCNTHVYFRVRTEEPSEPSAADYANPKRKLDMTVCCRSNDMIWGAYGANAVHFSFLLEYMAGRIGVEPGTYVQFSNNFHAYCDVFDKMSQSGCFLNAPEPYPIGKDWSKWDADLRMFAEWTSWSEEDILSSQPPYHTDNPWFANTAQPLYVAHTLWRKGEREHALEVVMDSAFDMSPDWRYACTDWMQRRLNKVRPLAMQER